MNRVLKECIPDGRSGSVGGTSDACPGDEKQMFGRRKGSEVILENYVVARLWRILNSRIECLIRIWSTNPYLVPL